MDSLNSHHQNKDTLCQNDEEQWSIEDDTLFHPCGLISKPKDSNQMKMSRVRIPLPTSRGNSLRSIHTLKYNTILLMSDGQIYCFGSIKALHSVIWLSGVRCFAPTDQGFSVIREREQHLLLETYLDLPGLEKGESTLQHTFDITYDEQNIFQCDWKNDEYTLTALKVSDEEEDFMQRLFGDSVVKQQYVHIFSIAGHLFALVSDPEAKAKAEAETEKPEQAYHIELLCVYAASIHFVRLLPRQNLCLVVLSSGSVDIWYVSKVLGIKERQMHHTGLEWLDYDFDATSKNGDLYYTNGEQLVRLRVKYNAQLDECLVQSAAKSVPGIQACTWVSHSEQLVCLSDNNMFYRIDFGAGEEKEPKKTSSLMSDFTPAALQRLRQNTQELDKYERQPVLLQLAIQREHQKQQLVAVGRNGKWISGGCKACLEFNRQIPICRDAVMLLQRAPEMDLHSTFVYAIFKLSLDSCEQLMHSSHWKLLMLIDDHQAHVHVLPAELLLKRCVNLVFSFKKRKNERLPDFTLKLFSFIELHGQLSAVILPIVVEESRYTYSALFGGSMTCVNLRSDNDLPMYNKKTGPTICQKLRVPNDFTLAQMANLFNADGNFKETLLEIFFLEIKLRLKRNTDEDGEEHNLPLTLHSDDPSAIYYFKHHLLLNMDLLDADKDYAVLNQVMKFQCETERLYGTQGVDGSDCGTNIRLRLESQYAAIRNTIF